MSLPCGPPKLLSTPGAAATDAPCKLANRQTHLLCIVRPLRPGWLHILLLLLSQPRQHGPPPRLLLWRQRLVGGGRRRQAALHHPHLLLLLA